MKKSVPLPLLPPPAEQQSLEGDLKVLVAECVANWVYRAVDVAKPVPQLPEALRNTVCTEGGHQHHDVVGCPRHDEGHQDGAQGPCCLLFSDQ